MVTVVLLTTLLTPLMMRGAFMIKCPEDSEDETEKENSEPQYTQIVELQAEA
jgi:hypothetical protein